MTHDIRWALAIAAIQILCFSARSPGQDAATASHIEQVHRLIAQGNTQAAIAEYQAAVAAGPSRLKAQANLGVLQFFANQCDATLPHLKSALVKDPFEARVQALVGLCQKRASLKDPLYEFIHFRLAQIDRQRKKKVDADHGMKLFKEIRELKSTSNLEDARRAPQ